MNQRPLRERHQLPLSGSVNAGCNIPRIYRHLRLMGVLGRRNLTVELLTCCYELFFCSANGSATTSEVT